MDSQGNGEREWRTLRRILPGSLSNECEEGRKEERKEGWSPNQPSIEPALTVGVCMDRSKNKEGFSEREEKRRDLRLKTRFPFSLLLKPRRERRRRTKRRRVLRGAGADILLATPVCRLSSQAFQSSIWSHSPPQSPSGKGGAVARQRNLGGARACSAA